ncbi:MAG: two-component sensor histidine kinase, partial [Verrucomicrobiae bacterium]|nr:two-component sensor histidine kinase [Verrucomicrobiae bacterium]
PEEDRERIFRRFYRVDRARSREVDGFGLGLNLAWEIIRAMGGELRLAESSDKITRFEVRWKPESDE